MDTFLQTLRRRLRRYLEQRRARTNTETLVDGAGFCSDCREISARLEKVIAQGFDGRDEHSEWYWRKYGKRVTGKADLKHLPVKPESQRKKCGLCIFLTHMFEATASTWYWHSRHGPSKTELGLYIGSAKDQYGISNDFSHISDSFCMWVGSAEPRGREFVPRLPYKPWPRCPVGLALELRSDSGKIGGRLVQPYADFELVKSWFDDCTFHHGTTTCQTDASILQDIPGLRVIDCSSRRLVSWSQLPTNQDRNYVALSYVWGTKPDDENEGKHNISDRTVDWPLPAKLPPLIEDTITAVTQLGFTYLWIDRYCIPQGDEEAKHTQIQNMHSIYGSASLTIVAATGNDPSHGLPGVSLPRYGHGRPDKNPPVYVKIGSRTFVTVDTSAAFSVLEDSMWNSRAWTMQEAFLSCRCLVFVDDGAYFQCSTPRSHRLEAIHEPPALLQPGHPAYIKKQYNTNPPADSMILTKIGKAGDLELDWCLQLVQDYFNRSLTFENDTLNAFSGILKYMQSLKPPIHNLWGVLMLPEVISTSSGQRIRYNLVYNLTWYYIVYDIARDRYTYEELLRTTTPTRKEMFPSWTWADWRPRVELHGGGGDDDKYTINNLLELRSYPSSFTSLVDLSVELDDGRIVSLSQGYLYDSDASWLATLPIPPRILHIQGYTANPQLRYMTEKDWAEFNERTVLSSKGAHAHSEMGGYPEHYESCSDTHRWILIDAGGQHLQPLAESTYLEKPRCWKAVKCFAEDLDTLVTEAYLFQRQRGNQADTIKPYTECTFDFRVIVLGYSQYGHVYYMVLMKADSQTETFERIVVSQREHMRLPLSNEIPAWWVEDLLAKLTGEHAESYPGTPWVKMNTRIA